MMDSTEKPVPWRRRWPSLIRWIDSRVDEVGDGPLDQAAIDWLRLVPFIGMHIGCIAVIWVGISPVAVAVALGLYAVRMFAITAFYHRYFAHAAFKTSRLTQFIFAVIGASSVQRGALWWASQHRHHHSHSDQPEDVHSPRQHGFLWSHMGWFMARANFATRREYLGKLANYPELRFLDSFDTLVPVVLAGSLYLTGELLAHYMPSLNTDGPQLLVWGFFISTVALYHATFSINSLAHTFGSRRYETRDDSRNNFLLALLTFGEGWHNNHHHFPGSARQGQAWWEIDLTYYGLRLLALTGLIWDLKQMPESLRSARRVPGGHS